MSVSDRWADLIHSFRNFKSRIPPRRFTTLRPTALHVLDHVLLLQLRRQSAAGLEYKLFLTGSVGTCPRGGCKQRLLPPTSANTSFALVEQSSVRACASLQAELTAMSYTMHEVQIPHARHENHWGDGQFTEQQQADLEAQVRFQRQQVHDSICLNMTCAVCACIQSSPDAIRYTVSVCNRCVGSL